MGALHEGHRELIRHARRMPGAGVVAVSIFVNPLQFGPNEDLARYPRTLEADLRSVPRGGRRAGVRARARTTCTRAGARRRRSTRARSARELEGAVRPGHFAGVLTVVAKLFHIVAPGRRVLRREGLPAARAGPADGGRPGLPARRRRRADRPGARRPGALLAATPTSRPSTARSPRPCSARWPPARRVSARGPEAVLAAARGGAGRRAGARRRLPGAARPRPRTGPAAPAGRGCSSPPGWAPPGSSTTSPARPCRRTPVRRTDPSCRCCSASTSATPRSRSGSTPTRPRPRSPARR